MAKKTSKGAADDISLMAATGIGSDLDTWLNQQGIGADEESAKEPISATTPDVNVTEQVAQKESTTVEVESAEEEQSSKPDEPPTVVVVTGKTGKQRERYEGQFFRRIEGFKKPTNMMYMSEKTYRLMAFLLRCSKESNTKITMPEIMENVINQHIKDNEGVLTQMQQEHLERISKGF